MKISEYTTSLIHVSTMVVSWMMMITFVISAALADGNLQKAFVVLSLVFTMMSSIWTIISFDGVGRTSHVQRLAEFVVKLIFSKDIDTDDDIPKDSK